MASAAVPTNAQQDRPDRGRPTSSTDRQSHPSTRRHGPTTPLRRVSRGSFSKDRQPNDPFPLDSLEPAFAELSDALTDLNANFEQLQEMHSSLARFSESFASFLYGLNMNAFCNEFPQVSRFLTCIDFRRPLYNHSSVMKVTPYLYLVLTIRTQAKVRVSGGIPSNEDWINRYDDDDGYLIRRETCF